MTSRRCLGLKTNADKKEKEKSHPLGDLSFSFLRARFLSHILNYAVDFLRKIVRPLERLPG
jgi:hypothetical protein